MNSTPLLIEKTNLSGAWCQALHAIVHSSGKEITPLIISLTDFTESANIRATMDETLQINGKASVDTVSETIFPESLYQYYNYDREALYKGYLEILPRIKKIDSKNGRGTYFERLIAYGGKTNQLEIIISSYLKDKGVRRSKLQASIFDPRFDHTNGPYQGFPCLQHISCYATSNGGLILNSFYAIQYLFERAYGNWLGLINLGKFLANELHLNFERYNCFVGVEQLDHLSKEQAKQLLAIITS